MSIDYLHNYRMDDAEKERAFVMTLKRIKMQDSAMIPAWYRKMRNFRTWRFLQGRYDEEVVSQILEQLRDLKLITTGETDKYFHITRRGEDALKRGWVLKDCSWYNTGKATKYALYTSLLAIILTLARFLFDIFARGA